MEVGVEAASVVAALEVWVAVGEAALEAALVVAALEVWVEAGEAASEGARAGVALVGSAAEDLAGETLAAMAVAALAATVVAAVAATAARAEEATAAMVADGAEMAAMEVRARRVVGAAHCRKEWHTNTETSQAQAGSGGSIATTALGETKDHVACNVNGEGKV
jgi:hypothetical protein